MMKGGNMTQSNSHHTQIYVTLSKEQRDWQSFPEADSSPRMPSSLYFMRARQPFWTHGVHFSNCSIQTIKSVAVNYILHRHIISLSAMGLKMAAAVRPMRFNIVLPPRTHSVIIPIIPINNTEDKHLWYHLFGGQSFIGKFPGNCFW